MEDFTMLAQFKRGIHAMHVEHARNFFKEVQNPLTVEELQRAIEKKDERGAYVLLENGALVGYAFTKVVEIRSNPTILDQKLLFIEDMFIEQEYRRKGHGRRLMKELQQIAAQSGCGSIALDVWEWNTEAIAFYKALGLQPTLIRMKLWIQRQRDTSKANGTISSN